jgi:hypothetical protein
MRPLMLQCNALNHRPIRRCLNNLQMNIMAKIQYLMGKDIGLTGIRISTVFISACSRMGTLTEDAAFDFFSSIFSLNSMGYV